MHKPTERFTKTVEDYLKYRPSYPNEMLQFIIEDCGLTLDTIIADIGSGTGILAKILLDYGCVVYGVEPNQAMREAAENYLNNYNNFRSVNGTAEATTLANHSIDLITVGTAFHWFDVEKTKHEFQRVLKNNGLVLLVWNVRRIKKSNMMQEYEQILIKYCEEYIKINQEKIDTDSIAKLFKPNKIKLKIFKNKQNLNWEGFKGRLLSTSYSLRKGEVGYEEMIHALKELFERYNQDGIIEFLYDTQLYYGKF